MSMYKFYECVELHVFDVLAERFYMGTLERQCVSPQRTREKESIGLGKRSELTSFMDRQVPSEKSAAQLPL
ncbi:hypothetical protein PAXRUDRAFT_821503 [Paxillus rubicundulus Ve08.2h10]|uniref:Uncharacterized protein n=1 Tax=Paxillus rubicundulus Ve08.2h10 TaxID=930991 RepID=A0A0D0E6H5_9AGAM|nr:hypothetical protein PAXRUDRAFT_821503 [Paxillus rubicundulus Ve08.2h10]